MKLTAEDIKSVWRHTMAALTISALGLACMALTSCLDDDTDDDLPPTVSKPVNPADLQGYWVYDLDAAKSYQGLFPTKQDWNYDWDDLDDPDDLAEHGLYFNELYLGADMTFYISVQDAMGTDVVTLTGNYQVYPHTALVRLNASYPMVLTWDFRVMAAPTDRLYLYPDDDPEDMTYFKQMIDAGYPYFTRMEEQ